jgi:hypothetical protein
VQCVRQDPRQFSLADGRFKNIRDRPILVGVWGTSDASDEVPSDDDECAATDQKKLLRTFNYAFAKVTSVVELSLEAACLPSSASAVLVALDEFSLNGGFVNAGNGGTLGA